MQTRPEMARREHATIGKVSFFYEHLPEPTKLFCACFKTSWLVFQNQQLWDLGLATADMKKEAKVEAKISELGSQFDFVILAEFFDEGLVILASLLCWQLEDVSHKTRIKNSFEDSNVLHPGTILEAECPNSKQSEQHHL